MQPFTNRLSKEKSPYLLQHAHNPVDWYPWSDEAFEKAQAEDKPIFLSIGYATCHWCHVMEHESFESEEIAALMNEHFVCIKVDREERPDIDNTYMTVCQMMTGAGGWPLTIVMTPEKRPFYAATYIPPESRYGRIGMKELIPRIAEAWKSRREEVLESADQITDVLQRQMMDGEQRALAPDLLETGYQELMRQYDTQHGGFGSHPKFPTPHRLIFLLRQGNPEGIAAVEHTLEAMSRGGIYDQVGFGFHRYSTDDHWLLPHFEKMLYDQALLTLAYTEAYAMTGKALYRRITEQTLHYVQRTMTDPQGGFYTAEDADSEGEEGLFYLWANSDVRALPDGDFAADLWNLRPEGNYNDEATGQRTGKNIPHLTASLDEETARRLKAPRQTLFELREKRIHPLKDTKILTDWNGLMIAAFVRAGRVLDRPEFVDSAVRAEQFIESQLRQKNGRLWHRWREGDQAVEGQLDDYAFLIFGLLELYRSTLDPDYLEKALKYNQILDDVFMDRERGGYFMTADHAEKLIVRPKEIYDGALPSGNAIQMLNLLRLARLTGSPELEQKALDIGEAFCESIERSPSSFAQTLIALQFAQSEPMEIVLVGEHEDAATEAMLEHINRSAPSQSILLFKEPSTAEALERIAPFIREMEILDGKPTVYLCRNFACEQPISSLKELRERLP